MYTLCDHCDRVVSRCTCKTWPEPARHNSALNYPTSSCNFRHAEIRRCVLSYNDELYVLYAWTDTLTTDQINNEMIEVVW